MERGVQKSSAACFTGLDGFQRDLHPICSPREAEADCVHRAILKFISEASAAVTTNVDLRDVARDALTLVGPRLNLSK
jgi:hypothetical protein